MTDQLNWLTRAIVNDEGHPTFQKKRNTKAIAKAVQVLPEKVDKATNTRRFCGANDDSSFKTKCELLSENGVDGVTVDNLVDI